MLQSESLAFQRTELAIPLASGAVGALGSSTAGTRRSRVWHGAPAFLAERSGVSPIPVFAHKSFEETAMNLSTGEMALIFAGCVLAIGVIVVLWRRGVFAPKATGTTNAASTGEPAK
jgi:hypothetical protein